MFNERNKIINTILVDITNYVDVAPYALQSLGYILFNELVARYTCVYGMCSDCVCIRCIEDELADRIISGNVSIEWVEPVIN